MKPPPALWATSPWSRCALGEKPGGAWVWASLGGGAPNAAEEQAWVDAYGHPYDGPR